MPLHSVGNPVGRAAGQRGAEASVESGGMASLFGPWQLVEPFAQTRSRRIKFELARRLAFGFGFPFYADLPLAVEVCRHVTKMGRPADNQQVRGLDQLRRSVPDGDTLDMGFWICFPNAVADCLGDFTGVTEQALVHDGDLYPQSAGSGARLPRSSQPWCSPIKRTLLEEWPLLVSLSRGVAK